MKKVKMTSMVVASLGLLAAGSAQAVTAVTDLMTATTTATFVANPSSPLIANGTMKSPLVTAVDPTVSFVSMPGWAGYLVTLSGGAVGATPLTVSLAQMTTPVGQPLKYVGFVNNTTARSMHLTSAGNLVAATVASPTAGLSYSSFGVWNIRNNAANAVATPVQLGTWASAGGTLGGALTTALAMPKVGSAVYTGKWIGFTSTATNVNVQLSGNVSLSAAFAAAGGTVTGSLTGLNTLNSNAVAGTVTSGTFNNMTVSAGKITGNAFVANITAGAPGTNAAASLPVNTAGVGTFKGHFYGPAANEVAGVFRLVSGTRQVMGAFGAKK